MKNHTSFSVCGLVCSLDFMYTACLKKCSSTPQSFKQEGMRQHWQCHTYCDCCGASWCNLQYPSLFPRSSWQASSLCHPHPCHNPPQAHRGPSFLGCTLAHCRHLWVNMKLLCMFRKEGCHQSSEPLTKCLLIHKKQLFIKQGYERKLSGSLCTNIHQLKLISYHTLFFYKVFQSSITAVPEMKINILAQLLDVITHPCGRTGRTHGRHQWPQTQAPLWQQPSWVHAHCPHGHQRSQYPRHQIHQGCNGICHPARSTDLRVCSSGTRNVVTGRSSKWGEPTIHLWSLKTNQQ